MVVQPFIFTHTVKTFETDSSGKMTPSALLNILQYTAGKHANVLGWSVRSLHESGQTWVLQRFYIQINELPQDEQNIKITTYPSGSDRLLAFRDYKAEDEAGNLLLTATSAWVILDLSSRRVVAVPDVVKKISTAFGPSLCSFANTKLFPLDHQNEDNTNEATIWVRRHDLDLNGHVNNVRYMEWGLEAIPDSFVEKYTLNSLDIVFKAECFKGDELISISQVKETKNNYSHEILRKEDHKLVCLMQTSWK
ncbi:MAG: hypothetical protein LAT67_07160 [Balneolales bacterium]|nr:hypothetical protein [Balneolales bacterium]